MDLNGIFSILEKISKDIENNNGTKQSIMDAFDKKLGIGKEQHDKVVSLIDAFSDSEENIEQYNGQINECTETINELNDAIRNLEDELSKVKKKSERRKKQSEIDEKKEDRNRVKDRRDRLTDSIEREKRRKEKSQKQLGKYGITNMGDAKNAAVRMDDSLIGLTKGGGMAKALASLKSNPWMLAVDGLIKAVEFGIGKSTEYVRLNTENMLRSLNATTKVTLNQMTASLNSWQDVVSGAYSAQELAIDSQLAMIEAQNATTMANLKMAHTWTDWIPILGKVNKYQEASLEQEQKLQEARLANAQKIIKQVNEYTKKTDDYIKRQNKAIHTYQAETGLSASQTSTFEDRMLGMGETFAKYNKTIEDALKMQSQYAETSGRTVNFSNVEYEKNFAVGRIVGEDNLMNFEAQMNIFNQSVSDSADIMYEMYKDANRMGISQKKLVKDVLGNLKLANKYDFKNGTKGFIELSKWAENARFNLDSLGGALEKIQSGGLENTITTSAKLQVLGGPFAAFSDPLGMEFEANADPDAYAKRIQKMFSTMGSFDKKTGQTTFNPVENKMIRSAAESLGISVEDAKNMARGARQKDVVKKQMQYSTLNPEDQDAIANKAQFDQKTGQWYVNTIDGKRMNVGDVKVQDLDKILSGNKEEDATKYAQSTLSIAEQIEATAKEIDAKLGMLTFANFKQMSKEEMDVTLGAYSKYSETIRKSIEQNRWDALTQQKKMLEALKNLNSDYVQSKSVVETKGQAYSKDHGENLRTKFRKGDISDDEIDELKANPKYRKGMSVGELRDLRKRDTRGVSVLWDWHRDSGWVAGDEGDDATRYRPKELKEYATDKRDPYSAAWAAQGSMAFKDAISSGNGSPMVVSASNVTPIQDGSVKLAKSDPRDRAIFAKTGGPFDTLFNGIFDKINEVHSMLSENGSTTNNRFGGEVIANNNLLPRDNKVSYNVDVPYPSSSDNTLSNEHISISDLNLNINGKLELPGENGQAINIIEEMKRNPMFVRQITEMVVLQMNNNTHGGRNELFPNRFSHG